MSGYVANGTYTRTNSFGDMRDPTFPRFFVEEVKDEAASAAAGRAIYRSEERVELIVPGNTLSRPVMKVTDEHRQRFAQYYEAFKKGDEQAVDGTPLEQWPIMTRPMIRELKAKDIYTIEQCASLSDLVINSLGMGGHALRERARAYLDDAERIKLTEQLALEKDRQDAQIAAQNRQIEELKLLVDQLHRQVQAQAAMPNAIAAAIPLPTPADMAQQAMAQLGSIGGGSALDALAAPKKRGRPSNAELARREAESV